MATAAQELHTAPANNEYMLEFEVDGLEVPAAINLADVPMDVRIHLLKTAAKAYVHNRVSTAAAKTKTANEHWATYDAAVKNDPLQSVVARPDFERATTDYIGVVNSAINALLTGNLGRKGSGAPKKPKVLRDPLITQITRAVVAKVYRDNIALNDGYKYPTAQKEVGSDGMAYLRTVKLPEWLAAGGTQADFDKTVEIKYVNPAKIMLGMSVPKSIADAGDIL